MTRLPSAAPMQASSSTLNPPKAEQSARLKAGRSHPACRFRANRLLDLNSLWYRRSSPLKAALLQREASYFKAMQPDDLH